jgi:hypothetical protein
MLQLTHLRLDGTMKFTAFFRSIAPFARSIPATNFTGDILNGVPVISYLDLPTVPSRNISQYYLQVSKLNGGSLLHIPILVTASGKGRHTHWHRHRHSTDNPLGIYLNQRNYFTPTFRKCSQPPALHPELWDLRNYETPLVYLIYPEWYATQ